MANSPTVVSAALSDKELQASINNMVTNFEKGLQTMLEHSNNYVDKIQGKLKEIGNTKFNFGGSTDDGISKRTKAQNAETDAIEKSITARDKQIKKNQDVEMSFDQIAAALSRAQRTVSEFNTNRASGILPSTEDYKRYEQALARIVEYHEKLRQSALGKAFANEQAFAFDARRNTKDLFSTDDRLKQLNKYYAEQEKASQKAAQESEKENQKRLAAIEKEQQARQKMIESARKAEEKYQDGVLKSAFRGALTMPTNNVDEITRKIERITTLTATLRKEGLIDEAQVNRANATVAKLNEQLNKQLTTEKEIKAVQVQNQQSQTKSARESYLAFQRGFKEQANQIAQQVRDAETALNKAIENRVNELNIKLATAKAKLNELNVELARQRMEAEKTGNYSTYNTGISRTTQAIEYQMKHIAEIQKQITEAPNMFGAQVQSINALKAEHERVSNIMKEEVVTQQHATSATQQQSQAQQQQTSELDKQLQKIKEINSSKSAKAAYEGISLMPTSTIEQLSDKLQALQALKEKVAKTPLLSKSNQAQLTQAITDTKLHIEQLENRARGTNISKKSLDELNSAVAQTISLEKERRNAILQTGIAAQESFAKIRQSAQIQLADNTDKPIMGLKELTEAIRNMESAYWGMEPANRESPLGQSLKRDIENAKKLRVAIDAYNKTLAGLPIIQDKSGIDKTLGSYNELSIILKTLTDEYRTLGREERNATKGDDLANKIQRLNRETQKIQQQMNRPINLDAALKGSEKTLDDIAYKMQRLASYRSGLNVDTQKSEINQVNAEYERLKKKMDEVMQKNNQMISSNNALTRSWNYMKNRLAFYFTVGASTQFIKNLIEVRSQYELNERALGILVDSAERGTQIFNELSQMALVSPYTLIELSNAAKQLTAYDVAAKDVVDTTRRLADMTSAVGVPIERLTYALGQIKAYGYLNSRDARMFANAGIPLVKQLSDHYTDLEGHLVSVADIYDRIKKKQIGYEDVTEVIYRMTDEGGKFFDFQAKMAQTLKVQLANLTLAWNNMLNDMGESNQWLLSGGIGALKELFLQWEAISRVLTNVAVSFGIAKAAQLLLNLAMGKGTIATIARIGALEGVTSAQYKDVIASANLTKAQAKFLIAMNRNNVALRAAIVNTGVLTAREAESATMSKLWGINLGAVTRSFKVLGLTGVVALQGLWAGIKSVGAALWSIATNPLFIAMTAIMAVVDAMMYYNQVAEKTEELNNNIAKNAKEASDSLNDFLRDTVNIGNRAKATQGILSAGEAEKTWEALREQIELSSDAASTFISSLLEEEDINKRIAKGFNVAESIRDATNALAGLNAEALQVSQDSWLWGLFGEGLAEDTEDYIETLKEWREEVAKRPNTPNYALDERVEAEKEIRDFADNAETVIRDRLGAGVNDAIQLKEAVERIKKEVKAANPQIKGEVAKYFDVSIDKIMAEKFGAVYDQTSSLQKMLIENIKRDSGAALKRLSDDILDTSKQLDDDVIGAIEKAWKKLETELPPEAQDLISKLQKQFNENPLELRVLLLEAGEVKTLDKIQKDYEQHFYDEVIGEKPQRPKSVGNLWADFGGNSDAYFAAQKKHEREMVEYNKENAEWEEKRTRLVALRGEYNKKEGEDRTKWGKRLQDEIKTQDTAAKSAQHTISALEKELQGEALLNDVRYKSAKEDLKAAQDKKKAAQEAYDYEHLYNEEKQKGGRGGAKKDPILDTLKQEISLVEKLQSDYDKLTQKGASQADALDTIRSMYGKTVKLINNDLQNFGLPQLNVEQLITGKDPHKALEHFKETLNTLVSKGMLTLERAKEIEGVVDKFTLSAKTYDLDKITKGLNSELGKLKDEYELAVELDTNPELGDMFADMFGIDTSALPHSFSEAVDRAQDIVNKKLSELKIETPFNLMKGDIEDFAKSAGIEMDSSFIKELINAQNTYRDIFKKNLTDTEKMLDDYVKKYGDYTDKIAEIESDRLTKLKKLNEAYYTEEMRKRPEYIAKLNAIEQGASKAKQAAAFEDFKNSRYYTMMFENLDYVSTKTIRDMRDHVRDLMDTMNDLTPEQLKQLMTQYEKLEQKLVKRSPFKTLTKDLKEYFKTSSDRKKANEAFRTAQKEYDVQKDKVAEMKENYKQLQASSILSKKGLKLEEDEINKEQLKLYILRLQLETTEKKADKYNLIAKLAKSEAAEVAKVVATNLSSLGELRDNLQDSFGFEFSEDINNVIDGLSKVGEGINKITSSLSSGDIIGAISGIVSVVKGFGDAIFGGKTDYFTSLKDSLDDLIDIMGKVADYQLEALGKMTGSRAAAEYRKLLQNNQEIVDSYRDLAVAAGRSGASAGSHSYASRTNSSLKNDWKEISKYAGQTVKTVQDMYNLEPEQLKNIMTNMPLTWARIEEDIRIALEGIIEYGDKVNEYTEKFGVALTNISVDDLTGDFEGMLQDMDSSAEDFAENFEEYMRNAIIRSMMVGTYNTELEAWYENFKKKIEDDELSEDDVTQLRKEYLDIVNRALADRDRLTEVIGETAKQADLSALQQGIQGVTEETASALEAYMNSVSQQVYLQSDVLTQIRDMIGGFNLDVSLDVQSQMLLQLQQSYQIQMAIQNILVGWSSPSGMAVRVEMV